MLPPGGELHNLEPEDFLEKVHSFEFWFQAVGGYLSSRPHAHRSAAFDPALEISDREGLVTTLCNYCVGETAALEASSGMIRFAPNRQSKIFLATQVVDEARHLEVFLNRLRELGVPQPEAEIERRTNRSLRLFKRRLLELVDGKDWEAAVFAQNVILETMEFTVFEAHAGQADAVTREVLEGVIKDERRHLGFGENDLGRRLAAAPHVRARLTELKKELDPLVLGAFEEALEDIGVAVGERPALGRDYLAAVARLGFAE